MSKLFHQRTNTITTLLILAVSTSFTTNLHAGEIHGHIKINTNSSSTIVQGSARAVAYLTGKGLTRTDILKKAPVIAQKNRSFQPRVLAVTKGQEVIFKNEDPVHHNVWSLSKSKAFDLGSFKSPQQKPVTFEKPGLIKTFCNIHPGMMGSVLVLKNSFHSTSDEKGNYKITDIPPGTYTLRVWAEGASPLKKEVTVSKTSKEKLDWTIESKLRSKDHLDKNGKPYKSY